MLISHLGEPRYLILLVEITFLSAYSKIELFRYLLLFVFKYYYVLSIIYYYYHSYYYYMNPLT